MSDAGPPGLPPLRATALPAGAVVVADLHLDLAAAEPPRAFLAWLAALDAPELLVLGDLCDFWVGPAQARLPAARAVLDGLRARVAAGTRVGVVPGNRDFLLGAAFTEATGCELWPAGFVAALPGGGRGAFVHGDELCTRDRGYQRLRRVLRSRPVGWSARHLPLPLALGLARRLRRATSRALAVKPDPEKALQPDAAARLAARCGARLVVCGHAHAHRDERLPAAPGPGEGAGGTFGGARWIVLDAFGGPRSALTLGPAGEPALAQAAPPGAGGSSEPAGPGAREPVSGR